MSKFKLCVHIDGTNESNEAANAIIHDFNTEAAAVAAREWFLKKYGTNAIVIHDDLADKKTGAIL